MHSRETHLGSEQKKNEEGSEKREKGNSFYGMHGLSLLAADILWEEKGDWTGLKLGAETGEGRPTLIGEMNALSIHSPQARIKVLNAAADLSRAREVGYSEEGRKLAGFLARYIEITQSLGLDPLAALGILKRELYVQFTAERTHGVKVSGKERRWSGTRLDGSGSRGEPNKGKMAEEGEAKGENIRDRVTQLIGERKKRRREREKHGGPVIIRLNKELESFLKEKFGAEELQGKFAGIVMKLQDTFKSSEQITMEKTASMEYMDRWEKEQEEHEQAKHGGRDED